MAAAKKAFTKYDFTIRLPYLGNPIEAHTYVWIKKERVKRALRKRRNWTMGYSRVFNILYF